jgi:hypothetical protein
MNAGGGRARGSATKSKKKGSTCGGRGSKSLAFGETRGTKNKNGSNYFASKGT